MFKKNNFVPFSAKQSPIGLASKVLTAVIVFVTVAMTSALPANAVGVLPSADTPPPGPGDLAPFMPGGPNYQLFAAFGPVLTLIYGGLDFLVLMYGIYLLITSVAKAGAAGNKIEKRSHALTGIFWGIVLIVFTGLVFPVIFVILSVAKSIATQI
jgi:hypothetical protein